MGLWNFKGTLCQYFPRHMAVAGGIENCGFSFFCPFMLYASFWKFMLNWLLITAQYKSQTQTVLLATCLGRCLFLLLRSDNDSGYRQQQRKLASYSCSEPARYFKVLSSPGLSNGRYVPSRGRSTVWAQSYPKVDHEKAELEFAMLPALILLKSV